MLKHNASISAQAPTLTLPRYHKGGDQTPECSAFLTLSCSTGAAPLRPCSRAIRASNTSEGREGASCF